LPKEFDYPDSSTEESFWFSVHSFLSTRMMTFHFLFRDMGNCHFATHSM